MTPNEYQRWTKRNWGSTDSDLHSLSVMALGLGGESGEVLDMIKKHIRTGKPMDRKALTLELGDLLHYLARTAAQFGIPLQTVMVANRTKIEARNRANKNWKKEKNT